MDRNRRLHWSRVLSSSARLEGRSDSSALVPHPRKPRGPGNGCSGHHYRFIRWYSRGVTAWRIYTSSIGYGLPHCKAEHDQSCYAAECERGYRETHRHQHCQHGNGHHVRPREHPEHPTPVDPSLTLTRMQCPAIVSKRENKNSLRNAGNANLCNAQQPLTAQS